MAHLIVSSLLVLLALDLAYIVTESVRLQLQRNSRRGQGVSDPPHAPRAVGRYLDHIKIREIA